MQISINANPSSASVVTNHGKSLLESSLNNNGDIYNNEVSALRTPSVIVHQPFNAYDPTLNFIENAIDSLISNDETDSSAENVGVNNNYELGNINQDASNHENDKKNLIQVCSCRIFKKKNV